MCGLLFLFNFPIRFQAAVFNTNLEIKAVILEKEAVDSKKPSDHKPCDQKLFTKSKHFHRFYPSFPVRCRGSLKFGVVVASQFNGLGDHGVIAPKHPDIKLRVAGKDVFHPVAVQMEVQADVFDLVILRGKSYLVG